MTIEHVALYVEDLENEKEFFEKYFGGEAGCRYHDENTGWLFMQAQKKMLIC